MRVAYQDIKNITNIAMEFIKQNKLVSIPAPKEPKSVAINYERTGQFNIGTTFDDENMTTRSPYDLSQPSYAVVKVITNS